jgi:hypothetical protein
MKKRQKLSKRGSKKMFTKGAMRTNKRNILPNPMRGGIRL